MDVIFNNHEWDLADYTAADASSGIAGRIGFEIIRVGVHDDRTSDDTVHAGAYRNSLEPERLRSFAVRIRDQVAEIT